MKNLITLLSAVLLAASAPLVHAQDKSAAPTPVATAPAHQPGTSHVLVASVSYVSGAHNLKVGVQTRAGWLKDLRRDRNGDCVQQYRNGVPSRVVVLYTPRNTRGDL